MAHEQRVRFVKRSSMIGRSFDAQSGREARSLFPGLMKRLVSRSNAFRWEDTCGEKDVRLIQLGYAQSQAEMSNASHVAHLFEKFTFRHSEALNRQPRTYDRV